MTFSQRIIWLSTAIIGIFVIYGLFNWAPLGGLRGFALGVTIVVLMQAGHTIRKGKNDN